MNTKICTCCQIEKTEDQFYCCGNKLTAKCKECLKEYAIKWQKENKDKVKVISQRFHENHKEKHKEYQAEYYKKTIEERKKYKKEYYLRNKNSV